ncbi:MAG: transcriptional repressor [Lautropia sp.]|nr:transcriptional repressor [Lautropia sp.]
MPARKSASGKRPLPAQSAPAQPLSASERDHLDSLQQHCQRRGAQLTPLRLDVLTQLLQRPGGMKAYDLLAAMQARKPGIAPMSIYRTLDFLVEHELVHKVDATSTFVICEHGHHDHHDHGFPIMLICEHCGQATECKDAETIAALSGTLGRFHAQQGFQAHGMEIKGRCRHCSAS